MSVSNFLDDLKNAVDNGEFNSESAKKINEINEMAEKKINDGIVDGIKKNDNNVVDEIPENELPEMNGEYEKKMSHFKKIDDINLEIATLSNIDEMLTNQHMELNNFISVLNKKYENDDKNLSELKHLFNFVSELEKKYNIKN